MSPKRLLVVVGSYFPAVGGGEHANAQLARLAREAGWEVLVITPSIVARDEISKDPYGVPVRYIAARSLAHHRVIGRSSLRKIIQQYNPSVVQFDGPNLHDLFGIRLIRSAGIPSLGFYHADFRDDNPLSRVATLLYGRTVLPLFDHVAVTTERYRARLLARGGPCGKITAIGLGADLTVFKPAELADYHARCARQTLLFVGRLDRNHSYKRIDLLIRALGSMPKAERPALRVIGDGNTRQIAESLTIDLQVQESVTFLGTVSERQLSDEYRNADLLVLPSPSQSEGFGMVLLEAYASGCPAVTSVLAGGREVIDRSGVGAVWDGRTPSDLTDAIKRSLTTGDARVQVALRARKVVEDFYNWDSVGTRIDAILNKLLISARVKKRSVGRSFSGG